MSKLSNSLVLLGLVTINIYIADSYTLTASVLNQKGYNNQSELIAINDNNIESIDPNAFIGYVRLFYLSIISFNRNFTALDLESFKGVAANLEILGIEFRSMNKLTNSKNVIFPKLYSLGLLTNLTSLNKAMFNAFPSLDSLSSTTGNLNTVDVHTFESLSKLTALSLKANFITSFEYLQIPKKLKALDLSCNNMNYFALSRTMGVLDTLDIGYNRFRSFKSMNFTFLANLTTLMLSYNPHAYPNEIPGHLKPLVKLQRVYLNNLSIISLDSNYFKNNIKLEEIYLERNIMLNSIDNRTFVGLNKLRDIFLSRCNLSKIASGTFYFGNLKAVDLSENQISQIDSLSFYGNSEAIIRLSSNKLKKLSPSVFYNKFYIIDLYNNQIEEIDNLTFDGVSKIESLYITNNKIEKIAPGSFKNIEINTLTLYRNFLTEINITTFAGLRGLISLDLTGNKIEKIEPASFSNVSLTNVTDISLSLNLLTELNSMTFAGVRELNKLDIGYNKIENIEPDTFNNVSISDICLDGNGLTGLRNTTFAGQNRLQIIQLRNNKLSTIEPGTFANLPNLMYVYLDKNQLTQLDSSMFSGSNNLKGIYLAGNPNFSTTNMQSSCPPAATQCRVYYYY